MHVRVKTITGNEVEIPHEEALRIAREHQHLIKETDSAFHQLVKERNLHILHNAHEAMATVYGRSIAYDESAIKEVVYQSLPNFKRDHAELLYELIEYVAANHHKKIYSAE